MRTMYTSMSCFMEGWNKNVKNMKNKSQPQTIIEDNEDISCSVWSHMLPNLVLRDRRLEIHVD